MNALIHRISRMGEAVCNRFCGSVSVDGVAREEVQ